MTLAIASAYVGIGNVAAVWLSGAWPWRRTLRAFFAVLLAWPVALPLAALAQRPKE
jgi:hypothetical protein